MGADMDRTARTALIALVAFMLGVLSQSCPGDERDVRPWNQRPAPMQSDE